MMGGWLDGEGVGVDEGMSSSQVLAFLLCNVSSDPRELTPKKSQR